MIGAVNMQYLLHKYYALRTKWKEMKNTKNIKSFVELRVVERWEADSYCFYPKVMRRRFSNWFLPLVNFQSSSSF